MELINNKKTCTICRLEKTTINFYKRKDRISGLKSECKDCTKLISKNYVKNNFLKVSESRKKNRIKNIVRHRELYSLYKKKRRINDIEFRTRENLRSRLNTAIRAQSKTYHKKSSVMKYVGISSLQFKKYLESKFTDGMSWDNYGKWHIDHIIPISKFNLLIEDEIYKAMNYNNLQPLWEKDNLKKKDKVYQVL